MTREATCWESVSSRLKGLHSRDRRRRACATVGADAVPSWVTPRKPIIAQPPEAMPDVVRWRDLVR